jgi:hypothetical protein
MSMFDRIFKVRVFLLLFIALVLYVIFVMSTVMPFGAGLQHDMPKDVIILDLQHGYSVQGAYDLLEHIGPLGRAEYKRNLLTIDIVFPLLYGLMFISLIGGLLKKINLSSRILNLVLFVPVAAAACDILENLSIVGMISFYPIKIFPVARAASMFTQAKFFFMDAVSWVIMGELLLLVCVLIWRKLPKRA